MTKSTNEQPPSNGHVTVIVTQRERFGMTRESLESLYECTPGVRVIYVDGNSPPRWRSYLQQQSELPGFKLIARPYFLTPNRARNLGLSAADTEYVVFCENDVLFTPRWLDRLVACADETGADVVAPLTCQGFPAHSVIHHAGGDFAEDGDMERFFADDPPRGRRFVEVMHGQGARIADLDPPLARQETGMCEFHCVLARRSVFDRTGALDETMWSTKEHIDFSMSVRRSGGSVWLEPDSVITYVFPCRARPMSPEDWSFFSLRWSDAYGRRSLEYFIEKWSLTIVPDYVSRRQALYRWRRWQGMLLPLARRVPLIRRSDALTKTAARAMAFPERLINAALVARQDRKLRTLAED